jgi:hypothetical protein
MIKFDRFNGLFKIGETVYEKTNPNVELIVRRYVDRIYFCQFADNLTKAELVLFEREVFKQH